MRTNFTRRKTAAFFIEASLIFSLVMASYVTTKAQCNAGCTNTVNVTASGSSTINVTTNNAVVCLTATTTTASNFGGTLDIQANNVTIRVAANVRILPSATIVFGGNNTILCNSGRIDRNTLTLENNLRVINSGEINIADNLTVNNGTLENSGRIFVDGAYTQTNPANVSISGPFTVQGAMSINGGDLAINSVIVLVSNNYTQTGGRVSGGNDPLLPGSGCGSLNVGGFSSISGGTFGQGAGLVGMCDPSTSSNVSNTTGFDNVSGGNVTPGGSIKCNCFDALPVELIYFRVASVQRQVKLNWATASEKNNDYFTIEKSKDGISFTEVTRVTGAGNSSGLLTYQYTDVAPHEGQSYYRLKQTDLDGKYSYSRIEPIHAAVAGKTAKLFPNPISKDDSKFVQLNLNDGQEGAVYVTVYDRIGKQCFEATYSDTIPSISVKQFSTYSGLYIIQARRGSTIIREKLLVY